MDSNLHAQYMYFPEALVHLISYFIHFCQTVHFIYPCLFKSYFHNLSLCCSLLLFAAPICCGIFLPAEIMKDWSYHRETEGKEKQTERELDSREYTRHRAAVSPTLYSAAVKCCSFNWSQTWHNTAVGSSQPDPKTTDIHLLKTQPPTHKETEEYSDRHGQDREMQGWLIKSPVTPLQSLLTLHFLDSCSDNNYLTWTFISYLLVMNSGVLKCQNILPGYNL